MPSGNNTIIMFCNFGSVKSLPQFESGSRAPAAVDLDSPVSAANNP